MSAMKTVLCPIHREGYIFIAIFAVVTLLLGLLDASLFWIGLILTGWCVYFFRNPDRVVPEGEGLVVSPGDGTVCAIETVTLPKEMSRGEETRTRVSIFLNVFNVHVNRTPIAGKISFLHYHPGKFLNASLDKASDENERQTCAITTKDGKEVVFVQIAGLVARRIVCDLNQDQEVRTGERYGIIRFGSRVDVYLPDGVHPQVVIGQTMIGGETILADLGSNEAARVGTQR